MKRKFQSSVVIKLDEHVYIYDLYYNDQGI
jgi:hypothetical protein